MIVTPTYSREMGEGGRLLPAARVPTLGLPDPNPAPTYKSDVGVYKTAAMGVSGAYDHNKNSLSDKEGGSGGSLGGHPLGHQLPAFTAPWLAEVAHITPARPTDHLGYPQPPPIPDYYPHYPTLPHRPTGYYHHHFLPPGGPPHFMRDYPRHAPRPYPPLDPRPTLERPTPVSGASTLVRPLGPPPLRGIHPDHRDLRDVTPSKMRPRPPDLTLPSSPGATTGEASPRGPHGEPSPKRRTGSGAFPMPAPRSPRAGHRAHPGSSLSGSGVGGIRTTSPSMGSLATAPTTTPSRPSATGPILSAPVPNTETTTQPTTSTTPTTSSAAPEEPRPSSPYHAHFARGALVTVGSSVRKVEDLETRDFLEAAREAEDLKLDPSTVAAIISTPANPTASTITFIFPSRNTQVSVEASLDHPFFVFHCGWSSCSPERTEKKYDLKVRKLQVGDVCVSLTKKVPEPQPPQANNPPPLPPPPPATTTANAASATPPAPAAATTTTATAAPSAVASGTSAGSSTSTASVPSSTTPTADSVNQPSTSSSSSSSPSPTQKPQQQLSPTTSKQDGAPGTTAKGIRHSLTPILGEGAASSSSSSAKSKSRIWTKPAAALRGTERQHSSDEAQREDKDPGRKRRWSDPGQAT